MKQILLPPLLEKVKLKASEILRQTKVEQIRGDYSYGRGNKFCALGALLHETLGWDGSYDNRPDFYELGMPEDIPTVIIRMNDSGASFNQIAHYLAGRGL